MASGWIEGLKKVGDVYHCRLQHGGREIRRSTGKRSIEAARKWLVEFRESLKAIDEGHAPAPTIGALVKEWDEAHEFQSSKAHRDRVMRDVRLYLLPDYRDVQADQFTNADASRVRENFLAGTTKKGRRHTAQGANNMHRHFRLIWRWGVQTGRLRSVPWKLGVLKAQRQPKVILPAALVPAFLNAVDNPKSTRDYSLTVHQHVRIAIRAELFIGLRESEALHMRWEYLSRDGSKIYVGKFLEDGLFRSKGHEAVAVPVPPDLLAMMLELTQDKVIPSSGWILPTEEDHPHWGQYTRKAILRAGKAVGIQGLTPHRMRGTCATLLARAGVDIRTIQWLLRHKDIRTTQGYIEPDPDAVVQAQGTLFGTARIESRECDKRSSSQKLQLKLVRVSERGSHNP